MGKVCERAGGRARGAASCVNMNPRVGLMGILSRVMPYTALGVKRAAHPPWMEVGFPPTLYPAANLGLASDHPFDQRTAHKKLGHDFISISISAMWKCWCCLITSLAPGPVPWITKDPRVVTLLLAVPNRSDANPVPRLVSPPSYSDHIPCGLWSNPWCIQVLTMTLIYGLIGERNFPQRSWILAADTFGHSYSIFVYVELII